MGVEWSLRTEPGLLLRCRTPPRRSRDRPGASFPVRVGLAGPRFIVVPCGPRLCRGTVLLGSDAARAKAGVRDPEKRRIDPKVSVRNFSFGVVRERVYYRWERFCPSGPEIRIPLGIDGYLRSLYDAPMIVERTVSEVVGQTVSALRQATGLTQAELASAMRDMGFAWQRQTVARIERGVRTLNVDELVAVAAYFEMPVQAVLARPEVLGASSAFDEWRPIRIGERLVDVRDWLNAVWQSGRSYDDRPDTATWRAIDAVVGNLRRPWAAYWRRGDDAARAFHRARTEREDRKRSGPIFVVDQDVEIQTTPPLWGQSSVTKLEAGVPYTARDEFEAEAIRQTTSARVVTKQRAYRMRQRA